MNYIDRFELLALDMNGTFMFGQDRFGDDEDFAATYRAMPGPEMADDHVDGHVRRCCEYLNRFYNNPAYYDDFISVSEALRNNPATASLDSGRREAIEAVIAEHERGRIPEDYASCLQRLASDHRLALLSNLWSRPAPWLDHFAALGLGDVFDLMLFSSETRSIKPSPKLFELLLAKADVAPARALYVGDDLDRDIAGAKAAGMSAIWISHGQALELRPDAEPDRVVDTLLDLPDLPA